MPSTIMVPAPKMQETFLSILLQHGMKEDKAIPCADIFTSNSVDGVYTHGVNRFAGFVQYIRKGYIKIDAVPELRKAVHAIEQWDGNFGPGPLNARTATDRTMELARKYGMGCVALANNNHWMRGGYYGWHAAKAGFAFISWTNTIGNMPAWNAVDPRLGNNPLVMAIPYEDEAIVLDMAISQFSYGMLEQSAMKGEQLSIPGGYDAEGNLTRDPAAIRASGRLLPVGYWKGAGLSLLLDILAALLSGGLATHEITAKKIEYASQVFVSFDLSAIGNYGSIAGHLSAIIQDYQKSIPSAADADITYPGERVLQNRKINLASGIPVLQKVWDEILQLKE